MCGYLLLMPFFWSKTITLWKEGKIICSSTFSIEVFHMLNVIIILIKEIKENIEHVFKILIASMYFNLQIQRPMLF